MKKQGLESGPKENTMLRKADLQGKFRVHLQRPSECTEVTRARDLGLGDTGHGSGHRDPARGAPLFLSLSEEINKLFKKK